MKPAYVLFTALFLIQLKGANGQHKIQEQMIDTVSPARINFYVVNKPKTLDLYSRLVILRAKLRQKETNIHFVVLVVRSSKEAKELIEENLQKNNARIGTIWFDSHGKYYNGYSSFSLGEEEFSFKTINDTSYTRNLRQLATYCDENTRVGIGSCYGGATFEKPAHGSKPTSRMNGDSLMIGLAKILDRSTVYGTESWVMTKPGIFKRHSFALAGFPLQKRFKNEIYEPVWKNMGIWHSYSTKTEIFRTVNTVALNKKGSLEVKKSSYLEKDKSKRKLARNLKKLQTEKLKT